MNCMYDWYKRDSINRLKKDKTKVSHGQLIDSHRQSDPQCENRYGQGSQNRDIFEPRQRARFIFSRSVPFTFLEIRGE